MSTRLALAFRFEALKFAWIRSAILDRKFWEINQTEPAGRARYDIVQSELQKGKVAPVIVQKAGTEDNASGTGTYTVTLTGVGAGHVLLIAIGSNRSVSSITDSQSQTITGIESFVFDLFYEMTSTLSGTHTITVVFSSAAFMAIEVYELNVVNSYANYTASGTDLTQLSSPISYAGSQVLIAIAYAGQEPITMTFDSPFSGDESNSANALIGSFSSTSSGSTSATFTNAGQTAGTNYESVLQVS